MWTPRALQPLHQLIGITNPSTGTFGIEIELESPNFFPDRPPAGWRHVRESSLRGNGLEYITDGPTNDPFKSVNNLAQCLKAFRTTVSFSQRGSTHIHLNMLHDPAINVYGYWIVFSIVEPVLFRLFASGRNGNLFCLPVCDTGDYTVVAGRWLDWLLYPHNHQTYERKYASLNLDPVRTFGSVECRIFPPTLDPELVSQWCHTLSSIREMVRSNGECSFLDFIWNAKSNPEDFVLTLIPSYKGSAHQLILEVEQGCDNAFELARILENEKKVVQEKWKKFTEKKSVPGPGDGPYDALLHNALSEAVSRLRGNSNVLRPPTDWNLITVESAPTEQYEPEPFEDEFREDEQF